MASVPSRQPKGSWQHPWQHPDRPLLGFDDLVSAVLGGCVLASIGVAGVGLGATAITSPVLWPAPRTVTRAAGASPR